MVIIAGIYVHAAPGKSGKLTDLRDIAAGFLHPHDILTVPAQAHNCLGQNIAACAAGHIVQQDGSFHRVRHLLEMGVQAVLGGFVVVRGYQQKAIHAVPFRLLGQIDGGIRAVGTGTCDHGNPALYHLHTVPDHIQMFLMAHGGCLSRSPADDDGIRALSDLELHQFRKFLVIHASVPMHGGHNRHSRSSEYCHTLSSIPLPQQHHACPPAYFRKKKPTPMRRRTISRNAS